MSKDGEMGVIVEEEEEAILEVALFLGSIQVQENLFLDDLLGKFRVNLKWGLRGLGDNVGIMEREEEEDE